MTSQWDLSRIYSCDKNANYHESGINIKSAKDCHCYYDIIYIYMYIYNYVYIHNYTQYIHTPPGQKVFLLGFSTPFPRRLLPKKFLLRKFLFGSWTTTHMRNLQRNANVKRPINSIHHAGHVK